MGKLREAAAKLPAGKREELLRLLENLPPETEEKTRILRLGKGEILVRMQDAATHVYLLLEGEIKVMNQQPSGAVYAFADFTPPSLFGEFEAFADCPTYRGTLTCVTRCTLGVMTCEEYLTWMKSDPKALFERTRKITRQLVEQAGAERSFLFYSGTDRLIAYLCGVCKTPEADGSYRVSVTRQQIADETGFSVKTIQRGLGTLRERGLVDFEGRKLKITTNQHHRLLTLASEKTN